MGSPASFAHHRISLSPPVLVRPRGVLISSNLHFRDAETRGYRDLLFAGGAWLTAAIADGDTAMSVRLR